MGGTRTTRVGLRRGASLAVAVGSALAPGAARAQAPVDAPARAETSAPSPDAEHPAEPAKAKKPKAFSAPDLRYGHFFLTLGGGLWVPSKNLIPIGSGVAPLLPGGDAHLRLGVGVNGFVVLFAEGGVARASGNSTCRACAATSIDAGLGVSAHFSQGFAVDPWISYAVGYRHTLLKADDTSDAITQAGAFVPAIDFTKIFLGFDYFPAPWLGFGPYLGTDVGVRHFGRTPLPDGTTGPVVYADFQLGMRVTFDPLRAGAKLVLSAGR